jgi:hypothetical protein
LVTSLPQVIISQLPNQPQIISSPVIHRHEMQRSNGHESMFMPVQHQPNIHYPVGYQSQLIEPPLMRTIPQHNNNHNIKQTNPIITPSSISSSKQSPVVLNYRSDISSFIPDQYQQVMAYRRVPEPKTEKKATNIAGAKMVQSTLNLE